MEIQSFCLFHVVDTKRGNGREGVSFGRFCKPLLPFLLTHDMCVSAPVFLLATPYKPNRVLLSTIWCVIPPIAGSLSFAVLQRGLHRVQLRIWQERIKTRIRVDWAVDFGAWELDLSSALGLFLLLSCEWRQNQWSEAWPAPFPHSPNPCASARKGAGDSMKGRREELLLCYFCMRVVHMIQ